MNTLKLRKALLAGTALAVIGTAGVAHAATDNVAADETFGTGGTAVGTLDKQADPVIDITGGAATVTFASDFSDDDNGGSANNTLVRISNANSGVIINAGTAVKQTGGTGDTILATDVDVVAVTVAGTLEAASNTQDAINFDALTGAKTSTITLTGGAAAADGVIVGKITGGNGVDTLAINVTAGDAEIDGAIDLKEGADVMTVAGTNKINFKGAVGDSAGGLTITANGAATLDFDSTVVGNINLAAGATVDLNGTLTGAIDNTSGTDNVGKITSAAAGNIDVTGAVGATKAIESIAMSGTGEIDFQGAVKASTITLSSAGELEFADVTATTITSSSTGTLDFDGAVNANVALAGDSTVTLATGKDITGTVDNTSGTAAQGTLTIAGISTVTGNVGATKSLKKITAGAGATNFSGTVDAADIDFNGADTIAFAKSVTVTNNIDFADNDGTVTFADGANFTGDIDDTSDEKGTVTFSGSSTVTGNLGSAAGNSLKVVNANGAAGKTVAVSANIDVADDVNIGAGALTVGGTTTTGQDLNVAAGSGTFTGQVTLGDDLIFSDDGTVTFADGLVNITDDISTADGKGTIVFQGAGTVGGLVGAEGNELKALTLSGTNKTVTAGGNTNAADTTTIGYNTLAVTGTFDADANQTLAFTIAGDTEYGKITSTGNSTVDADTAVSLTVDTSEYIPDGTTYTIVDGTGGANVADLNAGKLTDDSIFLTFAQTTADDANLVVVASRVAGTTIGDTANNDALGTVLDALGAGGDAGLDTVQGNLQNAASNAAANEVYESLLPTVDGGASVDAATNVASNTVNQANTRYQGGGSGMSSGNFASGAGIWFQLFGSSAEQDKRDNVDGYDSDTIGGTVGVDTDQMLDNGLVGLALTYANTEVDSENANKTNTDIDTFQLALYAGMDLDDATYVTGTVGYGWNDADQTRKNVGGGTTTAKADYDTDAFFANVELGRDYPMSNGLTVTPSVLANYVYVDQDSYTETGSIANMTVDSDSLSIFELGLGVDFGWEFIQNDGSVLKPSLSAGYRYDFVGDEVETTSRFTGGGASFNTKGADPAQSTFNLGAAVTLESVNNWDLSASYDYEFKEDYDSHNGTLRARYNF